MFELDVTELDADGTVAHAVACRAAADRAEVTILAAAAHYADLHGVVGRVSPQTGRVLPGVERLIMFGGDGTPAVAEFAPTSNSSESLNHQLRKIIKNRGHFPTDDAVVKLLWLAIRDIEDKRARQRAKEAALPANKRKADGRLVEGQLVNGWKAALGALVLAHPDRLASHIN